jgi:superfamily II DNA or RNA helicase
MWSLADVRLDIGRVPGADAARQLSTAREILRRFESQPGVVLADEVGMGKTYVALAVAASVVESTYQQVVVMVPPSVRTKWPQEWQVFREKCLPARSRIRATDETVVKGAEFLKLLDDPASRRKHIIFLSHSALSGSIGDDFLRFALVRQAFMYQRDLTNQRRVLPRWAPHLFRNPAFRNERLVEAMLDNPPRYWSGIARTHLATPLADDPVPQPLFDRIGQLDMSDLRNAIRQLPLRASGNIDDRLALLRRELDDCIGDVWREWMSSVKLHLPLLIMDEAHHLRNPWTVLAELFDPEVQVGNQLTKGPLATVFDRMLFLTATPFQLGHHELIQVLKRFDSVRWVSASERQEFNEQLEHLTHVLDEAQLASVRLDDVWGRLTPGNVRSGQDIKWWAAADLPLAARDALDQVSVVEVKVHDVERYLRPWVIRHLRPNRDERRRVYAGAGILDLGFGRPGIRVEGPAVLPFLLAARAQALVATEVLEDGSDRKGLHAFFADGLASSFEAYRDTRGRAVNTIDGQDTAVDQQDGFTGEVRWYLDHLDRALPRSEDQASSHPKMAATVERVRALWSSGEKIVVFCFYVATGRALRYHISHALEDEIVKLASPKLGGQLERLEVIARLDQLGERFFDDDSPASRATLGACLSILSACRLTEGDRERAAAIIARFLRTPSFLARYVDLADDDLGRAYEKALAASDASGLQLQKKIEAFGRFLEDRVESEREAIFEALRQLPSGRIRAASAEMYDPSELGDRPGILLPNVRLVNGGVKTETRRRLMYAFNTPFFPEVLIASAVLSEGVDLHLDCRHVIHHDLNWNPSVLEQRTGRVDRLGSKSELSGLPICVFEPYVAGTQDEKQYRVVKDRERWFNVVMGATLKLDEHSTDRLAERVQLPIELANRLGLNLQI